MKILETKYEIEKKSDHYCLYKIIYTDSGANIYGVFKGTRQECLDRKKELSNGKL
jgi:hypothetical protein